MGFYKTTPIHSHNQALKIRLVLRIVYWYWFFLIFVFNSMPIIKLLFLTLNFGFCKIGLGHSNNQTLSHFETLTRCAYMPKIMLWSNIKSVSLVYAWKFQNIIVQTQMFNHMCYLQHTIVHTWTFNYMWYL